MPPSSIELQLPATAYVGQLKDKLNSHVGKRLGLSDEDIAALPRMTLASGRKTWSDVNTLRTLVQAIGGTTDLQYGTVRITIASADLRDPPRRSPDEEAELERVRILHEIKRRQQARTRNQRPTKLRSRT